MSVQTITDRLGIFSSLLGKLGAVSLVAMMCLTTMDVVGRYVLSMPVVGAYELTEFLVLILIFSYLGYTQAAGHHVSVELLVNRLPQKVQLAIHLFNHTVSLILMALIAWKGFEKALEFIETGENSPNLSLPKYPFVFFLTVGCAVMCIEYLRNILQVFQTNKGGRL